MAYLTLCDQDGLIPTMFLVTFNPRISIIKGFCLEVICTATFVLVILVLKTERIAQTEEFLPSVFGVIMTIVSFTSIAAKSGASFNPAVGFA